MFEYLDTYKIDNLLKKETLNTKKEKDMDKIVEVYEDREGYVLNIRNSFKDTSEERKNLIKERLYRDIEEKDEDFIKGKINYILDFGTAIFIKTKQEAKKDVEERYEEELEKINRL
jgi:hypothetical protein